MTTGGGVDHSGEPQPADPAGSTARGEPLAPPASETLERIAAAGAVLQAFADGTLEVPGAAAAGRPGTAVGVDPAPSDPVDDPSAAPDVTEAGPSAAGVVAATPGAVPEPARGAVEGPVADGAEPPTEVLFRPRTGARRLLTALLLLALVGLGLTAWRAYADPAVLTFRVAATLAILVGVLAVLRARASVAQVSLVGDRLEILRDGTRLVFDLADPHTELRLEGRPGTRGWRAVIPRRGMAPVVIDARTVDPRAFAAAVEARRGARPGTKVPT
jgi:hypothetical protein